MKDPPNFDCDLLCTGSGPAGKRCSWSLEEPGSMTSSYLRDQTIASVRKRSWPESLRWNRGKPRLSVSNCYVAMSHS